MDCPWISSPETSLESVLSKTKVGEKSLNKLPSNSESKTSPLKNQVSNEWNNLPKT